MFCRNCGYANLDDARYCTKCNTLVAEGGQPKVLVTMPPKNPGVAAVLSFFFCGVGQIYNGQILKGFVFIGLYAVSLLLIFVIVGLVTTPILWICGIVDAYRTAERINAGDVPGFLDDILPAIGNRPILITLCCLIGFAGVPMAAYVLIQNREAIVAFSGWSFIVALTIFGSMGLAGLIGYWRMRRWGLYLYATMTALSLLYAVKSGSFYLAGSLSSIAITAIGCAYYTRME